jgi:phytoene dehydrogenase-like protein
MKSDFDAIVIGGGHNGLAAAAWLAKAGRKVLVLERRATLGGAAATEELFPGFHFNTGAPDAGLLSPQVIDALEMNKHGLEFIESPVAAFAPQADGRGLTLWRDAERSAMEIAAFSAKDARAFHNFVRQSQRFAAVLAQMARLQPPTLKRNSLGLLAAWARLAVGVRGLGGRSMMAFLRALPMSAAQYLNEQFESDALKGLLSSFSVTGSMQGPRASGTAFMLLYQMMGAESGYRTSHVLKGGVGQLSEILARAASGHGAEIRTRAEIRNINVKGNKVVGVTLASGETISAGTVLSSADPRTTFLNLLGPGQLEPRVMRRLRSVKLRGSTAGVHLTLNGLPEFTAAGSDAQRLQGDIVICPSLDHAERAYDDAKHGRMSAQPILIARIPSLLDANLAPAGKHTMSILVRYAPYKLGETNWDEQRERLGELVVSTLSNYAPNLQSLITNLRVITPLDYERDYGLAEGGEMHGQTGLDQLLLMRPAPGFVGYRSPIDGLYLCGAGAHPGGGVTGLPGFLAAKQAYRDIH